MNGIEQPNRTNGSASELAVALSNLDELKAIASELFGETQVEIAPDPEIEETRHVVFSVTAAGDPRDAADRRREWYRRTDPILKDHCDKVQLLIDISSQLAASFSQ